jgi:hypothetical protein
MVENAAPGPLKNKPAVMNARAVNTAILVLLIDCTN